MMLPFPGCPLNGQLGLGQVRVDSLLRFIHVLMTENNPEIQVET